MSFDELFNVFSKRSSLNSGAPKPLTATFRNRVFMRCHDLFQYTNFWDEIHTKLAYLHGKPVLFNANARSKTQDAFEYLSGCKDEYFLDFLEYIFSTNSSFHSPNRESLVIDFNEFFKQDKLPYAVTNFVWTKGSDNGYETITLTSYPQIIRKDSEAVYQTAIQPTLQLLHESDFASANKEFLESLEDFRKKDYGDCLVKCGSALESVLKVICTRNKWPHSATDTASPLLKTVIGQSGLESFFEQPLVLIATLRNKLSNAHGAGTASRDATEAKAEYAINATAAAILLLVKSTR